MFVRVILPLDLDFLPTYNAPEGLAVGDRVRVRFSGREYSAVVAETDVAPDLAPSRIRPVSSIDTGLSRIMKEELLFWKFLSGYYLCSIGEVFKAAYPKGKVSSEEGAAALHALLLARKAELEIRISGKKPGTKIYAAMVARLADIRSQLGLDSEVCPPDASVACTAAAPCEKQLACTAAAPGAKPVVILGAAREGRYGEYVARAVGGGYCCLVIAPNNDGARLLAHSLEKSAPGRVLTYLTSDTVARRRIVMESVRNASSPLVVVGTRTALFLPFRSLGLVVVDEEQDPALKQNESDPRFSARDAAVMLSSIHGAETVLGSASPSFETLYNIRCGKYVSEALTPESVADVVIVDIAAEKRKRGVDEWICYCAADAVFKSGAHTLRIVCGWEDREEVAAKAANVFAGLEVEVAGRGVSGSGSAVVGVGCRRVDATLVLQADAFFRRDDFRSDEKALHFLSRLAEMTGLLIVQTARPEHNVYKALCARGTDTSVRTMLEERRLFNLPPFSRLVDIIIKDNSEKRLKYLSSVLEKRLPCAAQRIADNTDLVILRLAFGRTTIVARKESLKSVIASFVSEFKYQGHISIDVDPLGW